MVFTVTFTNLNGFVRTRAPHRLTNACAAAILYAVSMEGGCI